MFPRVQAALGGVPLDAVTDATLQRLIDGQIQEDLEVEFKGAPYGNSDAARRDLATDAAALANSVGGVIFLGVRAEGGVAVERTPITLDEREEIRMRQIIADLVAPAPEVDIVRVESSEAGRGFYLLAVPPSPWRPHAVRVNDGLRYPRRDGPRIRYLSETEVADLYRSRFTAEATQRQRLDQIHLEGLEHIAAAESLWLTVCLVPDVPGTMRLDRAALKQLRGFAEKYNDGFGSMVFGGFDIATGLRRVNIRTGPDVGLSTVAQVELHTDGSAFAAAAVWNLTADTPQGRLADGSDETPWLEDEHLVTQLIALMRLSVEHAVEHCGVGRDAAVRVSLNGYDRGDGRYRYPARLMHRRRLGLIEPRSRVEVPRPAVSLHTIDVASCFGAGRELLVGCRLVLTDIYQAFGVPEVEQISEDGALRHRYFSRWARQDLVTWAGRHDVDVLETTLEEEGETRR